MRDGSVQITVGQEMTHPGKADKSAHFLNSANYKDMRESYEYLWSPLSDMNKPPK
jgi:hypothetical protein